MQRYGIIIYLRNIFPEFLPKHVKLQKLPSDKQTRANVRKVIRDGHLYIIKDGKAYSADGKLATKTTIFKDMYNQYSVDQLSRAKASAGSNSVLRHAFFIDN